MNEPFALDDRRIDTLPHTDTLPGDDWHTDGCSCSRKTRRRVIVARYPDDGAELWGCLKCRGLYWRPTVVDDHESAPEEMRDDHNVSVTV